jgi:hypothetical protein
MEIFPKPPSMLSLEREIHRKSEEVKQTKAKVI